jgi:Ran GTPase-activating protein (RanGAP) involved in mRNA processing and transport
VMKALNILLNFFKTIRWFTALLHLSIHFFDFHIQSITQLNLSRNNIGDEGAKHLAEVLRNNKVIHCTSSSISFIYFHFHIQTITQLNLEFNRIGDEGAKYLAEVLRNNQVSYFVYWYIGYKSVF